MFKKTLLALSMTAALAANAQTFDISTGKVPWQIEFAPPGAPVPPSKIAEVIPTPRPGRSTVIPGAEWISLSKSVGVGVGGSGPDGLYGYSAHTPIIQPNQAGEYCLSLTYAANTHVSGIALGSNWLLGRCSRNCEDQETVPAQTLKETVTLRPNVAAHLTVEVNNPPANVLTNSTALVMRAILKRGVCEEPEIQVIETPVGIETDQNVWRLPVAGDWDGDGIASVGWYQRYIGRFVLWNSNDYAGKPDVVFHFGPKRAKWLPIVGDWDGDGNDEIGLYNPWQQVFHLRYDLTTGTADEVLRR